MSWASFWHARASEREITGEGEMLSLALFYQARAATEGKKPGPEAGWRVGEARPRGVFTKTKDDPALAG